MAAIKPNIVALVESLPATDKEKEVAKAASANPPADPPKPKPARPVGSKFDAPDPEVMEKMCAEVLAGGPESLRELIALIRDPAADDFQNYKAEYLCHCLTVYAGAPNRAAQRRLVVDVLAEEAGDGRLAAYARGFLVRELQFIGDDRAVGAVGALLTDPRFCDDAARTLLAIQEGAVAQFRNALPRTSGRSRLVMLQSLGVLRDAGSVSTFIEAASDRDRELRLAGLWGLARIGSAGAIDVVLKGADAQEPWERVKATQACILLAETLAAKGKKTEAVRMYTYLRNTRTNANERYVSTLAAKALEQLNAGQKLT